MVEQGQAFYLYDERMLLHFDSQGTGEGTYYSTHPETPLRISSIYNYLKD